MLERYRIKPSAQKMLTALNAEGKKESALGATSLSAVLRIPSPQLCVPLALGKRRAGLFASYLLNHAERKLFH